jgi:hypothetical protein
MSEQTGTMYKADGHNNLVLVVPSFFSAVLWGGGQ